MKWIQLEHWIMMCPVCFTKFFHCDISYCPHCGTDLGGDENEK